MFRYRSTMYGYRMNRATFALWMAVMFIAYAVVIALDVRPPAIEAMSSFAIVPRLHDLGRNGRWFLLVAAVEILAFIIGASIGGKEGIRIAGGAFLLLFLLFVSVLGMIPGQRQSNRWGDPPPRGIHGPTPKRAASEPGLEAAGASEVVPS